MKPAYYDSQIDIIKNDLNKARARATGGAVTTETPAVPKATKRFNPTTGQVEPI